MPRIWRLMRLSNSKSIIHVKFMRIIARMGRGTLST